MSNREKHIQALKISLEAYWKKTGREAYFDLLTDAEAEDIVRVSKEIEAKMVDEGRA